MTELPNRHISHIKDTHTTHTHTHTHTYIYIYGTLVRCATELAGGFDEQDARCDAALRALRQAERDAVSAAFRRGVRAAPASLHRRHGDGAHSARGLLSETSVHRVSGKVRKQWGRECVSTWM